jgi:uncharacterized membrane protein
VVTGGTLLVAFGLLAAGVPWFWVAFPVGFGAVLPAAVAAARDSERGRDRNRESNPKSKPGSGDTDAALATLRERYAAGEIDEATFEARLERLLETETVKGARERPYR